MVVTETRRRFQLSFLGPYQEDKVADNEGSKSAPALPSEGTLTINDVLEYIGFGKFHLTIGFLCGLLWVGDAMEILILSILSPQLHCEWRLETYQIALMSSVVFLGMGTGSLIWGVFSDKYGRRVGLISSACTIMYFGLLSAVASVYSWFLFLRFLVGFGIGAGPQAITMYSEFLPMTHRGSYLAAMAFFWALGSLLEILLALLVMPTLGWRWLLGLSMLPMGVFLVFSKFLPESPRFDILSGRTANAMDTLRLIAKQNGQCMPEATIVTSKEDNRGQIRDLFTPQFWRTTVLLSFIWFSNTFCYYGIILLTSGLLQSVDSCGLTLEAEAGPGCQLQCKYLTLENYQSMLWTSFSEFLSPIMLVLALDRIGRKKSLAFCFFMFFVFTLPLYSCPGSASITFLILTIRAFSSTSLQVCYVYTPEAFPTKSRALGIGFCSGFGKVGSLISPFVSEVMGDISMYLTLSIYCGCSLLAAIASLMLPVETMGKLLMENSKQQQQEAKVKMNAVNKFSGE